MITVDELIKNHTGDIILVTDSSGRSVWANDYFTELTGYSIEEIIGKKPGSVLQGADTDPETVELMRSKIKAGEKFNVNIVNYHKDGKKYWLNINCVPVYNEEGKLENFVAVERDITSEVNSNQAKLNSLIQELREADEQKQELLQHMYFLAHDLKSPLNNIAGLFDIISSGIQEEELKGMIKSEVARTKAIIDKILVYENPNEGIQVSKVAFDLKQAIDSLIKANHLKGRARNLKLNYTHQGGTMVISDQILVEQVFENVLVNALKYADSDTAVEISTDVLENAFEMVVCNYAEAMTDEKLQTIFSPFQNFQSRLSSGSSGIGTYIVKQHLDRLAGRIDVSLSKSKVEFRIKIPF